MGSEPSTGRGGARPEQPQTRQRGNLTKKQVPASKWKNILSNVGLSISSWYTLGPSQAARKPFPDPLQICERRVRAADVTGPPEWCFPRFISLFFPEFPFRSQALEQEFEVLAFIAKGSSGSILKVSRGTEKKIFAVKVLLKTEVLRQNVLQQCKDEVIIQKQVRHPFVLSLLECWQTSRQLFIMCNYCSTGDLFMLWSRHGPFAEGKLRVFAAELGSALGFLHDFGVIHRDVKMENILINDKGHLKLTDFGLSHRLRRGERAYTICGTMQYMAPEVLSGGPYNHSSDWWSLGILLHVLATNRFPVKPELDHSAMLASVQTADFTPPASVSHSLAILLAELLCKNPLRRLRLLDHFAHQHFFQGLSFDPDLLQKIPMGSLPPDQKLPALPDPFGGFDCDLEEAERLRLPLAG